MFPFGKRSVLRLAVELLLVCVLPVLGFAAGGSSADGNYSSMDAAALYLTASQIAAPSGADVIFLEDQERVSFDLEGKTVRTRYYLYKVLTQKGVADWSSITAGWEPWHEERPVLRARVITPDLVVHTLDTNTITDAPGKVEEDNMFDDRRVLRAPLPAIAPGALVEEELVSKESAPFLGGGTVDRFFFTWSVPIEHTRLILDAPSALPLRYDLRLLPNLNPLRTEADGRLRIVFENGHTDAVEDLDPDLPSDFPAYASVAYSTGVSWQHLAESYARIVDQQLATSDLKSLVSQTVAAHASRDQKISAILQYLDREVRFTGVEFGEAAVIPRPPNETLNRKYGDCKDKASLLVAMLRTANIPAYLALLNVGSRADVHVDLPGLGAFDHAIVFVPGSPDLWIDATDDYARLGELPDGDQGRLALIARRDSTSLTLTPVASSGENTVVEKREIILAENGPARIIETSLPQGSTESSYRRFYTDKESKKVRDGLTDYMKTQYLAEKLDRMDRSDPHDLSRPFELVLESDRAKRGGTDLDNAAAAIRLESIFSRLPAELRQRDQEEDKKVDKDSGQTPKKARTADYQLPQAFVTEWRYAITPPLGFRPKPLPQNVALSLGPAKLTEQFATGKDGTVQATIRFDTVKRRMSVAEGKELRDKLVQLLDAAPILIYFEPIGQALLAQGQVREALKSYRDLIALHPQEAVHHLQLAQAFLVAGLGEAARAEARTAVKLESNSALAEKTLAEILEYDSVGRKLRPGSDYAGAEAAYRAAIALDPGDKANIANLAVLLEYNRWGLRYGPGSRLKDALVEYRKLTTVEINEFEMRNNIPFALFYDGQFAEAQKSAEAVNPPPVSLLVACEAALNGSAAALTEARKRTGQDEEFKQVAKHAGDLLINLRRYSLGADLDEAGESGDGAATTAAFVSLYRKIVPFEQIKFSDDPAGIALRFEVLVSDPGLTIDQLHSVTSRNGSRILATTEALAELIADAKSTISQKARNDKFAEVGLDLSLARAQPKVQGNDATGYKVTLWPSASYKSVRYIVKEEGHYKILGTSQHRSAVALEVLDRVEANDLAGARVLLDWLREDTHVASGDDPLAGSAFPRLWTKGKLADAATIRIAAASLLAQNKITAPVATPILESAAKSATSEIQKGYIEIALIACYFSTDDYAKILPAFTNLATLYPESDTLFSGESFDLRALGRFDEANALAEQRLKTISADLLALRELAQNAQQQGDYGKARAAWLKIIDNGQAEPQDLNGSAWNALFTGKTGAADLETAIRAAQLSDKSPNVLHTLGCVYAEVGKTKESREVLVQAMDALDLDEPDDNYWYAFGRIAEQYGERAIAVADYSRVAKPKYALTIPSSSYRLAQMHLQAMQAEKGAITQR